MGHATSFILTALTLLPGPLLGKIIVAAGPDQAQVEAAIASARSGDTIHIRNVYKHPGKYREGNFTWASDGINKPTTAAGLTITEAGWWNGSITIPNNKKLTIKGDGEDKTIIVLQTNGLKLGRSRSRVTGIRFVCWGTKGAGGSSKFGVQAYSDNWFEVDHCLFDIMSERRHKYLGVWAGPPSGGRQPVGVIHNCKFYQSRIMSQGNRVSGDFGRTLWADATYKPGTRNTVFVEDCYFKTSVAGNCMDDEYGGSYVFRHNRVFGGTLEAHGVTSASERGNKFVEIYNNHLTFEVPATTTPIWIRGGTARVYNNTFSGPWPSEIVFDNETKRHPSSMRGYNYPESYKHYPWQDQCGRGSDTALWDGTGFPKQTSDPMYEWSNTHDGVDRHANWSDNNADWESTNSGALVAKKGRDWHNDTKAPGYTPVPYPHPNRSKATRP